MKYLLAFVLVMAGFLIWSHIEGYRLNVTPSLAKGIYRITDKAPKRGDIVAVCLSGSMAELARERGYIQSGSCPSGLRPLLKILAALPNDKIIPLKTGISCLSPEGLACFWPAVAKKVDSLGRPV